MAENKNCVKTSSGSLQFYISTKSVKDLMEYMEKSMYSLQQTWFYCGSVWLKMGIFQHLFQLSLKCQCL